jgi:hypothetical protein
MSNPAFLFRSGDLGAVLEGRKRQAWSDIDSWNPDEFLATPAADITEYLISKHSIQCPVLDRSAAEMLPVSEETAQGRDPWGDIVAMRMTKMVVAVPFDGEADIFRLQAATSTTSPPSALVRPGELHVTWLGDTRAGHDPAAIRVQLNLELDKLEQYLSWSRRDIDQHNAYLRAHLPGRVAQRRDKLLADRNLQAGTGIPVRQRPDAAAFAAPVTRRKIQPPRPATARPFTPEPVLAQAQYEEALAVLRNARNALERSPSMTATLSEEKIRDLLLVLLNAQFEGAAAGEVFNAAGKTDILIRVQDRNIFIAECKIWAGPAKFRQAISQLLSYLTWRDTKAALLLFIRTGAPFEIIAKALSEIENHPNYKRSGPTSKDGERHDFVLRPSTDPEQEIQLALLPFALTGN